MTAPARSHHDLKRARLIKLVHIAANELHLLDPKKHDTDPDDEYRLILKRWNRPGTRQPVTSSTEMSVAQLDELMIFFTGLGFKLKSKHPSPQPIDNRPSPLPLSPGGRGTKEKGALSSGEGGRKKYDSSIQGLREEIKDLAIARWTESAWEQPLNNFCRRFGIQRWQWLDVAHGKEVKAAILRLQTTDNRQQTETTDNQEVPF